MSNAKTYTLEIDLNVLNHLGLNLYSNVPSVLSELIANAWDADASQVQVEIDGENDDKKIKIKDDGIGMNKDDLNRKFLTVGYQRRTGNAQDSTPKGRQVMGRKGIGKLSAFSISEHVEVFTKKEGGEVLGLEIVIEKIRQSIESKTHYHPKEIPSTGTEITGKSGTVIILKNLKKRISSSLGGNLKKRVARRFDVMGDDFKVKINDDLITIEDRDYFHKLEYSSVYGDYDKNRFGKIPEENIKNRANRISLHDKEYRVTGWIGLARESGFLQDGDDNLNKISILTRGKVALEDIMESFREGGLYTKYVIGEIRADFLDSTGEEDIATSSRQDFVQNDERFISLKNFIREELKNISKKRVEIKNAEGEKIAVQIPSIREWYESLRGDSRTAAKSFFGRINQVVIDESHRKTLYKYGVLAFEHLRHKDMLSKLKNLNIENLEEAVKMFSGLDDIEASWYYEITTSRLEVIRKLSKDVEDDALEKVIQRHIYTHLWLLDPSWDRATETPVLEEAITTSFNEVSSKLSKKEKRGRVDIRYKKTSGKHVIVELKRRSTPTETGALVTQVDKYITALQKQLRLAKEPGSIEVICIVGKEPKGWGDPENRVRYERSLEAQSIRVVTYQQLIKDAKSSYSLYLEKNQEKGRIKKILDKIEEDDTFFS